MHEPWKVLGGLDHGYPEPIVDHAAERIEALERLKALPKGVQAAHHPHDDDDDVKAKPAKKAAPKKLTSKQSAADAKLIHDFE